MLNNKIIALVMSFGLAMSSITNLSAAQSKTKNLNLFEPTKYADKSYQVVNQSGKRSIKITSINSGNTLKPYSTIAIISAAAITLSLLVKNQLPATRSLSATNSIAIAGGIGALAGTLSWIALHNQLQQAKTVKNTLQALDKKLSDDLTKQYAGILTGELTPDTETQLKTAIESAIQEANKTPAERQVEAKRKQEAAEEQRKKEAATAKAETERKEKEAEVTEQEKLLIARFAAFFKEQKEREQVEKAEQKRKAEAKAMEDAEEQRKKDAAEAEAQVKHKAEELKKQQEEVERKKEQEARDKVEAVRLAQEKAATTEAKRKAEADAKEKEDEKTEQEKKYDAQKKNKKPAGRTAHAPYGPEILKRTEEERTKFATEKQQDRKQIFYERSLKLSIKKKLSELNNQLKLLESCKENYQSHYDAHRQAQKDNTEAEYGNIPHLPSTLDRLKSECDEPYSNMRTTQDQIHREQQGIIKNVQIIMLDNRYAKFEARITAITQLNNEIDTLEKKLLGKPSYLAKTLTRINRINEILIDINSKLNALSTDL